MHARTTTRIHQTRASHGAGTRTGAIAGRPTAAAVVGGPVARDRRATRHRIRIAAHRRRRRHRHSSSPCVVLFTCYFCLFIVIIVIIIIIIIVITCCPLSYHRKYDGTMCATKTSKGETQIFRGRPTGYDIVVCLGFPFVDAVGNPHGPRFPDVTFYLYILLLLFNYYCKTRIIIIFNHSLGHRKG